MFVTGPASLTMKLAKNIIILDAIQHVSGMGCKNTIFLLERRVSLTASVLLVFSSEVYDSWNVTRKVNLTRALDCESLWFECRT